MKRFFLVLIIDELIQIICIIHGNLKGLPHVWPENIFVIVLNILFNHDSWYRQNFIYWLETRCHYSNHPMRRSILHICDIPATLHHHCAEESSRRAAESKRWSCNTCRSLVLLKMNLTKWTKTSGNLSVQIRWGEAPERWTWEIAKKGCNWKIGLEG